MIQRIELENIQCHKHLTVDCDRITVLLGPSNVGKSAVVRALSWFFSLINVDLTTRGRKASAVTVVLPKAKITKARRDSIWYTLETDGKQKRFSRVGRMFPDELLQYAKVGSLNIQSQFEPFLLVFSPPSEINRVVLGGEKELTTLEDMQAAARELANTLKGSIKYVEGKINELKQKVEFYRPHIDKLRLLESNLCLYFYLKTQCSIAHIKRFLFLHYVLEFVRKLDTRRKLEQLHKLVLLRRFRKLQQHRDLLSKLIAFTYARLAKCAGLLRKYIQMKQLTSYHRLCTLVQKYRLLTCVRLSQLRVYLLMKSIHAYCKLNKLQVLYKTYLCKQLSDEIKSYVIICPKCGTRCL